ncbi:GNAT family N-acetyltransferase [Metaclostridioides mangenotii]|uniref:GNAT family N-acetyltransferase n=1 Tax=Metaclostridioides mangenotii TaxID=1540 RepID=UPI0028F0D405|nr:GNAT family N-acetyltransferase [Clostridioides mangenotii]
MIRKAYLKDLDQIMNIISDTVKEMKTYNNTQWDENYPQAKDFKNDIKNEDLYIDELDGQVVGLICVNYIEPNEYLNIKWVSDKKAMIIHRMAVNSNFRNQKIGTRLIEFAEEYAKNNDVDYLKTDTYSVNIKMNSLFKKFGYQLAGQMEFLGKEEPFNCYDKVLDFPS